MRPTENIQQTNALVGTSENYNQALLGIGQSIADHNVKIDQLNASLNTAEGQHLSFANAVGAGNEKFLQRVQNTRDAAVEAETFKSNLEGLANSFAAYLALWRALSKSTRLSYVPTQKAATQSRPFRIWH